MAAEERGGGGEEEEEIACCFSFLYCFCSEYIGREGVAGEL